MSNAFKVDYLRVALALTFSFLLSACGEKQSYDYNQKKKDSHKSSIKILTFELTPELAEGKKVWEANCGLCHVPGLAHAPKMGDAIEWSKRAAKGIPLLVSHAIEGFNEMPPRGANVDLTDAEVEQAVLYMVKSSYKFE